MSTAPTEVKPGFILELLTEAGQRLKRSAEFRQHGARDEELVCLKSALAHLELALGPIKDAHQACLESLQKGMAAYGQSGSRYYHFAVELGDNKLNTLDSIRTFEEGFFEGRRGEAIGRGEKAYMIGYRYGKAVRDDS
jgi:hypothetical protein